MGVTQYIGARYVPIFADPEEWTSSRTYEPLTIVMHEGNSFTSKQFVPVGIDIDNDAFWAETGNYNAQVEAYRQEVLDYRDDIENAVIEINEIKGKIVPFTVRTSEFSKEATENDDTAKMQRIVDYCASLGNKKCVILVDEYLEINDSVFIFNENFSLDIKGVYDLRLIEPPTQIVENPFYGFYTTAGTNPMFVIGKTKIESEFPSRVRIKKGISFENLIFYNESWNSPNQIFLNSMNVFECYSTSVNFQNLYTFGAKDFIKFPQGRYSYNGQNPSNYTEDLIISNIYGFLCEGTLITMCQSDNCQIRKIWCVAVHENFNRLINTYLCNSISIDQIAFGANGSFDHRWNGDALLYLNETNGKIGTIYTEFIGDSHSVIYGYSHCRMVVDSVKTKFVTGYIFELALDSVITCKQIIKTAIPDGTTPIHIAHLIGNMARPSIVNVETILTYDTQGTKITQPLYLGPAGLFTVNGFVKNIRLNISNGTYRILDANNVNLASGLFEIEYNTSDKTLNITSDKVSMLLTSLDFSYNRTGSNSRDVIRVMNREGSIKFAIINDGTFVDLSAIEMVFNIALNVVF